MRHFVETKARGKYKINSWGFLDITDDNQLPTNVDDTQVATTLVGNLQTKLKGKKK